MNSNDNYDEDLHERVIEFIKCELKDGADASLLSVLLTREATALGGDLAPDINTAMLAVLEGIAHGLMVHREKNQKSDDDHGNSLGPRAITSTSRIIH